MLALVAASILGRQRPCAGRRLGRLLLPDVRDRLRLQLAGQRSRSARAAPHASLGGVMMGLAFLTNFVANYLSGRKPIGAYYKKP